ncbi:MAG: hypothetical protein FWE20_03585 [Defluviitaleaceae bacterium]|nr:hypothetical protein [Defluviitaleaceae bacterium]
MDQVSKKSNASLQSELHAFILEFYQDHELNKFRYDETKRYFDVPVIGYADGDDPIFESYKNVVCKNHLTPREAYSKIRPDENPKKLTVISILLPQTKEVRDSNRRHRQDSPIPSYDWVDVKVRGREMQAKLNNAIVGILASNGINSFATDSTELIHAKFKTDPLSVDIQWSERHIAYAAGLGTFGLCGNIITEKGKAMRCASLIAAVEFPVTPRPYQHYREYCLFYPNGECKACIGRCPVSAISESGKNIELCKERIWAGKPIVTEKYDLMEHGCGLCQLSVPCEAGIPARKK